MKSSGELHQASAHCIRTRGAPHDEVEPIQVSWLGRIYPDAWMSCLCFFLLSLAVGQIWRHPFTDEMDSIIAIEKFGPLQMFKGMWGVLLHPPFFYALFSLIYQISPHLEVVRLFSLLCSTLTVFLFHQLFLNSSRNPLTEDRLIAIFAFATIPLLLRWGDTIRWYPIFTLLFALLVVTLVRRPSIIWGPAMLLGALSFVNIEGYLITACVVLYRYVIERRRISRDLKFLVITACFQALPLPFYYAIFTSSVNEARGFNALHVHSFLNQGLRDYFELVVGFFGGYAFGIGLVWVLLPIVALTGLALFQLVQRFGETDPVERLALVTFGLTAPWAVYWNNAYCFIYAALLLTYVILKAISRTRIPMIKVAVLSTFLLTNGAVIGNLWGGDHPFQRVYPGPYRDMAEAISRNFLRGDMVISTDPNLLPLLDARVDCVRVFPYTDMVRIGPDCPFKNKDGGRGDQGPGRVLLFEGHDRSEGSWWDNVVADATSGRRLVASIPYKYDADAELKTRLSGVPLDPFVFSIRIFE
jgi:hypothetical protein